MERMSNRIHTVYLLLILNLLLYNINVCFAQLNHRFNLDELKKKYAEHPVHIVREVPKKGQGSWQAFTTSTTDEWAPIRILVSMEDVKNNTKYCTKIGEMRPDFRGGTARCDKSDVFSPEKNETLTMKVIPAAIKLHSDRLLAQRLQGPIIVPPFTKENECKYFTVPSSHQTEGVANADMVLYLAAGPGYPFAIPCASATKNRPIVGAMSFPFVEPDVVGVATRWVAHEIAHALGFNYEQMLVLGMLTNVTGIRGKPYNVTMVTSPKTKEKAREYYNCDSLIGMELEDEKQSSDDIAHWEARTAKDELMSFGSEVGYYTALTMAAFEDMGFFRANWGMEEPMEWGRKAGCAFLENKCMEKGITNYPNMFCNETGDTLVRHCTSGRTAVGWCFTTDNTPEKNPDYFRYFETANWGFSSLTDYCPVIHPADSSYCREPAKDEPLLGSRKGKNSWCVDGESLKVYTRKYPNQDSDEMIPASVGGVCAEVLCGDKGLQVRYLGDNNWHDCPEGKLLTPATTSPNIFISGSIICPKYTEVCTVAHDGSSRAPHATSQLSLLNSNGNSDGTIIDKGSVGVIGNVLFLLWVMVSTVGVISF